MTRTTLETLIREFCAHGSGGDPAGAVGAGHRLPHRDAQPGGVEAGGG
jgi:hypothetical protein